MTAIETPIQSPERLGAEGLGTEMFNGAEYYRQTADCVNRVLPLMFPVQTVEGVRYIQRVLIEPRSEDGTRQEVDFDVTADIEEFKREAQEIGVRAGEQFAQQYPELGEEEQQTFMGIAETFAFNTARIEDGGYLSHSGKNAYRRMASLPDEDFHHVVDKLASCYMPIIHSREAVAAEEALRINQQQPPPEEAEVTATLQRAA